MYPKINVEETGENIRRLMDKRGITAKDVQNYLELASVQSVYYWLNGTNLPSIDNMYALSELFNVPIDEIVRGNRRERVFENRIEIEVANTQQVRRLYAYCKKMRERQVA